MIIEEKKESIFDILKNLRSSDHYIFNDEIDKLYKPYLINKGLSFSVRTIFYANDMNLYHDLISKQQYDYYHYSIHKTKEFVKWIKSSKHDDRKELISRYFNCGMNRVNEIMMILSDNQIEEICKKYE